MTRGSKHLQKLLEKRDELISAQMDIIDLCNSRGNDLDTMHITLNDYKDRLKEENLYLRQRMWEEGWRFHNFYIVDPYGNYYPFFWGMDREPVSPEFFYFNTDSETCSSVSEDEDENKYVGAIRKKEHEILMARKTGMTMQEIFRQATEKFFDERKKEIEAKKQKEEELLRAREAAQQMQEQGANSDKPAFQILKRPPGCDIQSSSSQHDMAKLEEKTRTMTLQEREAAYLQARERIFGGVYRFDDDREGAFDPTLQMVPSAAGSVPTGMPLPHPSYHAPNPRPRLPAMMRTPRPPLYQPLPLGVPPFRIPPPPPGAYTPPLPPVSQQRFPMAGMHAANTQLQRLPYFDSRIPPPAAPPPPYMGQNPGQNLVGMNPSFGDPARNNPVPYGRPPTQLLSQNQFTLAFSDQSNRFY